MITLREYQNEAIAETLKFFENGGGNPLIVLPTGTGKSVVIADFCRQILGNWPDTKIVIVTHVRELIRQNYEELKGLWPEAPAGINSAGLNKREYDPSIVFCGIQSVYNKAPKFIKVDLVLVDEAHLIPRKTNTMYQKFLKDLKTMNPHVRVIGLTATPYRLDTGLLHMGDGALFDGISYEATLPEMIKKKYLTRLVSKEPKTRLDVSGVSIRGGEFVGGELERAVDKEDVNTAAVNEIIEYGKDRKSWLIFCAGVTHATHIAELIRDRGITVDTIFGDTPRERRDEIVRDFKAGKIRALASMGVLTTGFNAPAVDLIAMLRPTQSTGLYIQIMGRGMRNSPGKENCLVLDFAGNVERHGPVDRVNPKKPKKGGEDGVAPTKTCPECDSIVFAGLRECPDCGYKWPQKEPEIARTATTLAVLAMDAPSEWRKVNSVTYHIHKKPGSPDSMRVEYRCGLAAFREWVCFNHKGFPRSKAEKWWRSRHPERLKQLLVPTTEDAVRLSNELVKPSEILVQKNGKYTEIIDFRFVPNMPSGGQGIPVHSATRQTA